MGKIFWFLAGSGLGLSVSQNFKYKVCFVTNQLDQDRPINFSYPNVIRDNNELKQIERDFLKNKKH